MTDGTQDSPPNEPRQIIVPSLPSLTGAMEPVAKTWLATPAAAILVESVKWQNVAAQVALLPNASAPEIPLEAPSRLECLNQLPAPTPDSSPLGVIETSTTPYQPAGFVLDYITVPSSGTSYTFATSTTYYVSSSTYFSGTITFQPGCVIKFNGNYLLSYGSITCSGTSSNPSILTHYREDLFGEQVNLGSGCPAASASPALWDYFINANLSFSNMRFRLAQTALRLDGNGCGTYEHTISGCIFEECQTGIYVNNCSIKSITASTRSGVTTPTVRANSCGTISGSLTDVGGMDSDGNHLLDSDDYKYFGRLGTLPGNAVGQIAWRTAGHSPSTDQQIWGDFYPKYYFGTWSWLYGVTGLTSISVSNSYGAYQRAGTLITPRHAVVANHFYPPVGSTIYFVGSDNTNYARTVVGYLKTTPSVGDYGIIALNSDLPASVGYSRVFPFEALNKLTAAQFHWPNDNSCRYQRVPAVGFNQRKEAFVFDIRSFDPSSQQIRGGTSFWFSGWDSYCYRNSTCGCGAGAEVSSGDSGSPAFLLLNNELVLFGGWIDCPANASWHGSSLSDINQAIVTLDTAVFGSWTGYTATTYPISTFPTLW